MAPKLALRPPAVKTPHLAQQKQDSGNRRPVGVPSASLGTTASLRMPEPSSARESVHALWHEKQNVLKKNTRLGLAIDCFDSLLREHYRLESARSAQPLLSAQPSLNALPLLNWSHETAICIDGAKINANDIYLSNRFGIRRAEPVGCITAYPKQWPALKQQMQLLYIKKPSVLAVLANNAEIPFITAGYFAKNATFDNLEVTSVKLANKTGKLKPPVLVERYLLTIRNRAKRAENGEPDSVEIPVIYAPDWPDGTAMLPEELDELVQQILEVERVAEKGQSERTPVIHCDKGRGRAGQCMGHYVMKKHPEKAKSVENVVQDLKRSRDVRMVYALPQANGLGQSAASMDIPVLAIDRPDSLESFLDHLDIFGLNTMPDYDFMQMLPALKFDMVPHLADPERGIELLQSLAAHDCPMMVGGKKDRTVKFQYLWPNPLSTQGKSLFDGQMIDKTAQQFLQEQIDADEIDMAKVVLLPQAREIGDMALYADVPRGQIQAMLFENLLFARPAALDNVTQIAKFLNHHKIATHVLTVAADTLEAHTPAFAAVFDKSKNFMVEFKDNQLPGAPLVRYVIKNKDSVSDGWLTATRYTPLMGTEEIHFPSFANLVSTICHAGRSKGGDAGTISFLNSEKMPALAEFAGDDGFVLVN